MKGFDQGLPPSARQSWVHGLTCSDATSFPYRLVTQLWPFPGMRHLDVAGGTGDIAFRVLRRLREAEADAGVSAPADQVQWHHSFAGPATLLGPILRHSSTNNMQRRSAA